MSAYENVAEFLSQWQQWPDIPPVIAIPPGPPPEGHGGMGVDDLAAVLTELAELREQAAGRLAPVLLDRTDTVVHSVNPPLKFGLLPGTPVRFFTAPEPHRYVQVSVPRAGDWVMLTAWPGIEIRAVDSGCVRVRPVRDLG